MVSFCQSTRSYGYCVIVFVIAQSCITLLISFLILCLDAATHFYKKSSRSVRRSVRPFVPCYFRTTNMVIFEGKKSSKYFITNDTLSDDEAIGSDIPPHCNIPRGIYSIAVLVSFFFPSFCIFVREVLSRSWDAQKKLRHLLIRLSPPFDVFLR